MSDGFAVGEYVTDSSYIYEVTAIDSVEKEMRIYFKPISGIIRTFTSSVPLNNSKKAGIRKVLTKKEAQRVILELKTLTVEGEYNILTAKEEIYQNQPQKLISILAFYYEKADTLGKVDKDLREQILEHLCREIALVTKKRYLEVRREVVKILSHRNRSEQIPS